VGTASGPTEVGPPGGAGGGSGIASASSANVNAGWRKTSTKSPQVATGAGAASAGTGTSAIRWPKNVALARSSTSANAEADCRGIAAIASRRWMRQGEWTSRTGTAKSNRQGHVASRRPSRPGPEAGRRPTAWSPVLIASSSGATCPAAHEADDVVIRISGCVAPSRPRPIARFQPRCSAETTTASASRPSRFSNATSSSATRSGPSAPRVAITTTRTAAVGSGPRRAWSVKGSSDQSSRAGEGTSGVGRDMGSRGRSGAARPFRPPLPPGEGWGEGRLEDPSAPREDDALPSRGGPSPRPSPGGRGGKRPRPDHLSTDRKAAGRTF